MFTISHQKKRSRGKLFFKYFSLQPVKEILVHNGEAKGVKLSNGTEVMAKAVLSNATPKITYLDLLPKVCIYT